LIRFCEDFGKKVHSIVDRQLDRRVCPFACGATKTLIWHQYSMRQSQAVLQTPYILLVVVAAVMHRSDFETQETHLVVDWDGRIPIKHNQVVPLSVSQ
jgi:hypothetical protein